MNLPPPFQFARTLSVDECGRVALRDPRGKVLAYLPMETAFNIAAAAAGYGSDLGTRGQGEGYGCGNTGMRVFDTEHGTVIGFSFGHAYGDSLEGGSGYGKGEVK